ncbi:hypothetical protein [Chryseobacterium luquanense]|uniref:Uncharacterized protein n=1 Tax=Chryseobacterium luquanense TaxID=2983766 RepID=A0ABT3Y7G8_9FLAO|nr:hypothetical protein [Chryseobacterium luquanense]MCX8534120.1 hypothetical protein [Chryseobacterium luquanense]
MSGGKESVARLGLGKNYSVGSRLSFSPSESSSYYLGFKQRIELFSTEPGSGFYFYFVPLAKSHIKYAYFNDSEATKRYGDIVNLQIALHGYNLEKDIKYKAKLYLLEEEKAVGLTETKQFRSANLWKKPEIINIPDKFSGDNWNVYLNYSFPIEIEWRKNQSEKKNFTVIVEIYKTWIDDGYIYDSEEEERVDYRNFADKPTNDLVNYDANVLGLQDLDDKPSISSRFIVSEELMDDYLSRLELQKTNMIQYIGDIRYTKREYDPCGYSKITLKDEDDKERDSMVIFNEEDTENPIDQTAKVFTIITGDARKNISITLDKLKNKGEFCQGVLLEKGQKHTDKKNIFQLDRVMPALRMQDGNFVVVQDTTQKDDYDAVPDEERAASGSVSDAQEWIEGVDYKIDSDDKMTVMPRYLYNKTSLEGIQNYTSHGIPNEALNTLWVFNYFILNDKLAQTYFVPISTCRYPNQIAKINVYPDIEWEVSFIITTGETHTLSGGIKENLTDYQRAQGLKFSDRFKLSSEYKGFSFSTDISTKVNGDIHKFGLDKIENIIKKLADLKSFLDQFDSNNSENASAGGFTEYFSFKLVSPNIVLAFKWNFGHILEKEHNHKAVTMLSGSLKLAPLIGINFEVDLFIITDNIKVYGIGEITKLIRKSIEWVTETDIFILAYVNVELVGEFTVVYNSINGFDNKKSNRKAILSIPFGVKGGIKSNEENVIILPSGEKMEKLNAEISINSGIDIVEELGTDNKGPYKKNSYIFKGLNVRVVIVENVFSRRKISVIPKIDETFEILKENQIGPEKIEYLNNKKDEN